MKWTGNIGKSREKKKPPLVYFSRDVTNGYVTVTSSTSFKVPVDGCVSLDRLEAKRPGRYRTTKFGQALYYLTNEQRKKRGQKKKSIKEERKSIRLIVCNRRERLYFGTAAAADQPIGPETKENPTQSNLPTRSMPGSLSIWPICLGFSIARLYIYHVLYHPCIRLMATAALRMYLSSPVDKVFFD